MVQSTAECEKTTCSTLLKKENLPILISKHDRNTQILVIIFFYLSGYQNPVDIILFLVKKKKPWACLKEWQEPTKKTCRQGTLKMQVRSVTALCATCKLILCSFSVWEVWRPNGLDFKGLGWIKSSTFNPWMGNCIVFLSNSHLTLMCGAFLQGVLQLQTADGHFG